MVKTFALASIVYQDDLAERRLLPFKHHSVDDLNLLKEYASELQRDVALISTFGEFTEITGGELDDEQMVPEKLLQ